MNTVNSRIDIEKIIKYVKKLPNKKAYREITQILKKSREEFKNLSPKETKNFIFGILESKNLALGIEILKKTGVLKIILPEVDALEGVSEKEGYFHKDVYRHTMKVVDNISSKTDKTLLRFTALLHDIGKPVTKRFVEGTGWTFHGHDEIGAKMTREISKQFGLDKEESDYIYKLTRLHLRPINLSDRNVTDNAIRRFLREIGEDLDDLLTLCRTDITSGNKYRVKKHLQNFDFVQKRIEEVIQKDKERSFKLAIDGFKIMQECDIPPGKKVGQMKKELENAVKSGQIENTYEDTLNYLKQIKDKYI